MKKITENNNSNNRRKLSMVLNIENIFDHFTKLSFSSAANIPS
jgi:hypothetical protein